MELELYYLQSVDRGFCGNSPMFWRKNGNGYTPRLDDAEQFTWDEASEVICSSRSHKWKLWTVDYLDSISHRTVDMQDMKKSAEKKFIKAER